MKKVLGNIQWGCPVRHILFYSRKLLLTVRQLDDFKQYPHVGKPWTYTSIRRAGTNFVTAGIPTHFKNTSCSFVTVYKLPTLKRKVMHDHLVCFETFLFTGSSVFVTWVDQMWTHLSKLPDARNLPSGENATLYTGSVCLVSVWIQAPWSTSHSRTVESNEAL